MKSAIIIDFAACKEKAAKKKPNFADSLTDDLSSAIQLLIKKRRDSKTPLRHRNPTHIN